MELAIVSSERDWSQHFRRIVVTNCHYWLNRARTDAQAVLVVAGAEGPHLFSPLWARYLQTQIWAQAPPPPLHHPTFKGSCVQNVRGVGYRLVFDVAGDEGEV